MTHPEPPLAGDETATLLGSLERVRSYVEWKCGGLDAAGLQVKIAASSITLGGLLKHLALVEDDYSTSRLFGRELGPPWNTVDWDADRDWEWHSAAEDTPEQLMTLWRDAVARSRSAFSEALADGGGRPRRRGSAGRLDGRRLNPDRRFRGLGGPRGRLPRPRPPLVRSAVNDLLNELREDTEADRPGRMKVSLRDEAGHQVALNFDPVTRVPDARCAVPAAHSITHPHVDVPVSGRGSARIETDHDAHFVCVLVRRLCGDRDGEHPSAGPAGEAPLGYPADISTVWGHGNVTRGGVFRIEDRDRIAPSA